MCTHRYGHRVLLQLLHPYCTRYLPPQLLAIARPAQKCYTAAAAGSSGAGGAGGEEGAGAAVPAPAAEGEAAGQAESDEEEDEEVGRLRFFSSVANFAL